MQFTTEVNWTASDFVIAGMLIFVTGLIFDLVLRKINNKNLRIALIVSLFIIVVLIWIELAVGIFGTSFSGS